MSSSNTAPSLHRKHVLGKAKPGRNHPSTLEHLGRADEHPGC
jgi:hypothetical protein